MNEPPLDLRDVLGIERVQLPRHIAIIMDGNGRWARERGLPRIKGHEAGTESVREVVTECARIGVGFLTLYSFSTENWKRPQSEIDFLMSLYVRYLVQERPTMMDNDIRFRQIGRRDRLSAEVLDTLDETIELTRNNKGLTLVTAIDYGSRTEIVDGVRRLAAQVAAGQRRPEDIDEADVSATLYTADMPDPDLLIRTANERRISNFLLWQLSYSEIRIEQVLWPDFRKPHLYEAIRDFAARQRRFGAIESSTGPSSRA